MNNIKTKDDILKWAKVIVDGNGDKYIPLGKVDMFAIAKYIAHGAENLTEDLEPKDNIPPPSEEDDVPPPPAALKEREEPPKATATAKAVDGKAQPDTKTPNMTRGHALHRAGLTTQQAYDRFLEWGKSHPKEAVVMDFSTGVQSPNAAFAYWLAEEIAVPVSVVP